MWDSLKDVKQKFEKTICFYKGEPVLVHMCQEDDVGQYMLNLVTPSNKDKISARININDPEFTYRNYNIGYVQLSQNALWLYRMPYKQWRQGLHLHTQVRCVAQDQEQMCDFVSFGQPVARMLKNQYDDLDTAMKMTQDNRELSRAVHTNFGLHYDPLHGDHIIEYKGAKIGSLKSDGRYKLLTEAEYLTETLRDEVLIKTS